MTTWTTLEPSADVASHYRSNGWWDGETLATLLGDALTTAGTREFRLHSSDRPWRGSISDVADQARRLATGLRARGVRPGDPVAFQLPNSTEAAVVFYGLAMAGAVLVPIGHSLGASELRFAIRASGARALVVANWQEPGFPFDVLADLDAPELEHVIAVGNRPTPASVLEYTDLTACAPLSEPAVVDPASPAVIGWTSGTTGSPKGVLLTHRAMCAEVRFHMVPMMAGLSPRLASTSPVSHVTGMLVSVLLPPMMDRDIHLMDRWDPQWVLQLMSAESLSAGTGAPLFLSSLIDHPDCTPEHHALIGSSSLGGAAVTPQLVYRASELGIVAWRGYGCTEHPSISLGDLQHPLGKRADTDGVPCAGVEIRVVGEDGTDLGTGEAGEVLTRGPDLFCGYTDPALNVEAFDGDWFRTGDIGRFDDEGYLTIVDRKKDIIIRAGLNISAAEIEAALISMPQIADVAVVAAPDPRTGERACAFVRPAPGCRVPGMADLQAHLQRAGIAKYKWPEEIRSHASDFPRTAAGKVRKADLRDLVRATAP